MEEPRLVYPISLEIRQDGGARRVFGLFRYGQLATMADRGRVRKERIEPQAFRFALDSPDHEINLIRGHNFDQPLASKRAGTLVLDDTDEGLAFSAALPIEAEQPAYMVDTVKMIKGGLLRGISPGFTVPPPNVVPSAEGLEPEPGNPDVSIRVVRAAVLYELSLVTRPAYPGTEIDARAWQPEPETAPWRRPQWR